MRAFDFPRRFANVARALASMLFAMTWSSKTDREMKKLRAAVDDLTDYADDIEAVIWMVKFGETREDWSRAYSDHFVREVGVTVIADSVKLF